MKGGDLEGATEQWSPTISLGTSVLIPETLRRRPATPPRPLPPPVDAGDARGDRRLRRRAGRPLRRPLPEEVEHLLDVMEIKALCRQAGVAQVDAGPRGAVVGFHRNEFANPEGLVHYVQSSRGHLKVQPDQKLVYRGRVGSAGRAPEGRARLHRPARRRRRQGARRPPDAQVIFFLKKAREGVGRRPRSSGAIGSSILIACQKMIGNTMTRNRPMPIRSFMSVRKPR